ncbi:MAG TPA: YebC/PmpR family DNA-binding transcriptional regulator [Gammaproteobacteria bacterium]|nr:YebC/PmpR family DNA-binding transcriptional regulator [Gammaproteobacteria bacterium]
MAGHSKWANIQHRKGAQDAKRGKLFTKFIREITVASRMGGGDPNSNPRLRLGIDKALAANMSKDVIQRAIQKGIGGLEGQNMEEITYEGYGPNGVAVLVECLTDNKNRTVSEVRFAFTKLGGNLGTTGSVNYLFSKKGQILFAPGASEDKIMEIALELGADDIITNDDKSIEVITSPDDFEKIKEKLIANKLNPVDAEITMIGSTKVKLEGDAQDKMEKLQNMLEELDDVQNVYSNAEW